MKFRRFAALCGVWLLATTHVPLQAGSPTHTLHLEVAPRFGGTSLTYDTLTNVTANGQCISVTRLDLILSDVALRTTDGTWLAASNRFAFISGREGRTRFSLVGFPSGNFDRLRFHVGVPATDNHADPAGFAPDHPLNPNVNDLHWNWQGGYVFLALEGRWRQPDGGSGGYSYHLATERLLMTVELPLNLSLHADRDLQLNLNVNQIFAGQHDIRIADASYSTHSREEDELAGKLRDNIRRAFCVDHITDAPEASPSRRGASPIDMAPNATPYRLTFSRFFPQPALPKDNPLTREGVALGERLFHDPRLSVNQSQSCASCHSASAAFADSRRYSLGAEGQAGTRNAMPLLNLAWKSSYFWDGRAASLREQVLIPIQNPVEMHETLANVVKKLSTVGPANQDYPALFAAAFATPEITVDRMARALEQFLLTQVSHQSKFDRALAGLAEFSKEEKRGFELFHTEHDPRRGQFGADCFHCHGGPLFQSQSFSNNGLEQEPRDAGRSEVTGNSADRGRFAVPSLRNVAVTAPYMHDGRFATLEAVVEHYATGVKRSATLDPNLAKHPDGGVPLSAEDKQALVAFLRTLTDERFAAR